MNARPHAIVMRELRQGLKVSSSGKRISADAHMLYGCAIAIAFSIGTVIGERIRDPEPTCRSSLPDGRKLKEYRLADGYCVYQEPKPVKWKPT